MSDSLKTDSRIDKHLHVLKTEEGELSSLEIATEGNGSRVSGDLEVTGYHQNVKLPAEAIVISDGNLTVDSAGDITLDAGGADINFAAGGTSYLNWKAGGSLVMSDDLDTDDHLQFAVATNGVSVITTRDDSDSNLADLSLDVEGDITLNSKNGIFKMEKDGTEFSPTRSSYSGMILGCTHVFGAGANGEFQQVSTAWESLLWDTDKYALVTFVVPPSNKVKISVFLPYMLLNGYILQLGLATDSSATSLGTKYENAAWDVDETDNININYSWVVDGSDHSWSAGQTKTIYIMAYADGVTRLYSGGTNTDKYGGVIVEATALPAIIGDGSEP